MKKLLAFIGLTLFFLFISWSILYCIGLISTGCPRPWEWEDVGLFTIGMILSLVPSLLGATTIICPDSRFLKNGG